MTPAARNANATSTPKTGLFVALGGLLKVNGSSAPISRISTKHLLCALPGLLLASLAFSAAPAFAASPEPPEIRAEPVFATTAILDGVLNPHGTPSEAGTYQFVYRESSKSECKGAGQKVAPAAPAAAGGIEHEEQSKEVRGLAPGKEYAACLVVKNKEGEASSTPAVFTTTAAGTPEAPEVAVEDALASVNPEHPVVSPPTEVVLHGVLNPAAAAESEAGTYRFVYRKSTAVEDQCEGSGQVTTLSQIAMGGPHEEVFETAKGLTAGTEYAVCVFSERADGKTEKSVARTFTTATPPQKPETSALSKPATATTVTLEGTLNPSKAAETAWHFLYSTTGSCVGGNAAGGEGVAPVAAKTKVAPVTLEGLEPHQKYVFCLVATNAAGEEAVGNEVSFETLPAGLSIDSESASGVKSTVAKLEAQINPNNQETTYQFEYATKATGETLEGTVTHLNSAVALKGYGDQTASAEAGTAHALTPGTTYFYRVSAENAQSKGVPVLGKVQSFTTVPAPSTDPVTEVSASTAVFNGHFTLDAVATTYSFQYKAGTATECTGESATTPVEAGTGSTTVSASPQITGLTPGTQYSVCLVTSNASGTEVGSAVTFTTPAVGPPAVIVGSYFETEVKSDSAELHAEVNPNGAETTYSFQYGPSTAYGHSTPGVALGAADDSAHPAQALVQGLTSGTTYHYRIVASNEVNGKVETVAGPDQTFTTPAAGGEFTLPDNRAWEQVSPVDKHGAKIESIPREGGVTQAAEDGSAVTYIADGPLVSDPEGNPSIGEAQYVAQRTSAGVWSTRDIAAPHEKPSFRVDLEHETEYPAFSPDLTRGLLAQTYGDAALLAPAAASEQTVYVREELREAGTSQYVPLIDDDNVAPGTHYARELEEYVGASSNLEHVVFTYTHLLTGGAPATGSYGSGQLYEWTAGALEPMSILPNGEWPQGGSAKLGDRGINTRNAISMDGSRVFFSAGGDLYVRENGMQPQSPVGPKDECLVPADACTVQLDLPQGGAKPEETPGAVFEYATPTGERVYFKDPQKLTANSTAETSQEAGGLPGGRPELYEYNTISGVLTDLTPDPKGAGSPSSDVLGDVIGATDNGEFVYFVAGGVLTPEAHAGEANLYVERIQGDTITPRLVATLSGGDLHDWEGAPTANNEPNLTGVTSRMSPNGRYLAFMSDRSLTGYDNVDAVADTPDEEVFEYDASTGRLACGSCDPTGARPRGVLDIQDSGEGLGLLIDRHEIWHGRWLAGSVPGWTGWSFENSEYQSRYLADDGRLFFDAADGLVPQDVNGKVDVYEYEPQGVGPEDAQCGPAAASGSDVFKPAHSFELEGAQGEEGAGCVALISKGTSPQESAFLDASAKGSWPGAEDGEDVFFLTAEPLVPADIDSADDVYDAHECSAHAPCAPAAVASPPCTTTDSCRVAPAPQPTLFGSPASQTFSGAGNLGPVASKVTVKKLTRSEKLAAALRGCKRDKTKKQRALCEASAHKRYGARARAKRTGNKRRTK